jgi:hypothetical protein
MAQLAASPSAPEQIRFDEQDFSELSVGRDLGHAGKCLAPSAPPALALPERAARPDVTHAARDSIVSHISNKIRCVCAGGADASVAAQTRPALALALPWSLRRLDLRCGARQLRSGRPRDDAVPHGLHEGAHQSAQQRVLPQGTGRVRVPLRHGGGERRALRGGGDTPRSRVPCATQMWLTVDAEDNAVRIAGMVQVRARALLRPGARRSVTPLPRPANALADAQRRPLARGPRCARRAVASRARA